MTSAPAVYCDGCAGQVSPEHLANRIRRLELASRFRPVHIHVLFIAEAPPPRLEDYFYYAGEGEKSKQGLSRVLFDELMAGVGIEMGQGTDRDEESCLLAFQKRSLFLADSLECPLEDIAAGFREGVKPDPQALADRFGPTLALRIHNSYKPKHLVLISLRNRFLIPLLQQAGLAERLLLYHSLPLPFPHPDNPAGQMIFREGMEHMLNQAGMPVTPGATPAQGV
jgi:hypothetical protein